MREITLSANAKINLTLDVLAKRTDGYHDVCMILQSIDLCDEVTVAINTGDWLCVCDDARIPDGEENLAMRAARAFLSASGCAPDGVSIRIHKRIPPQAGLGGGSADAAAVLRALNSLYGERVSADELMQIGARVGSDVPFCLLGGTALAEGRGERLTPLPLTPDCAYLLIKPPFSASTPSLYAKIDETTALEHPDTNGMISCLTRADLNGIAGKLCNVFLPVLNAGNPIEPLCKRLLSAGALGSSLTGTGSVVFGVFRDLAAAKLASAAFRDEDLRVYLAQNAR